MSSPNYYEILEVSPNATPGVIEAAYRRLVRTHHPDVGGGDERLRLLNESYAVLRDPDQRANYDRLRGARSPGAENGGTPPNTSADLHPAPKNGSLERTGNGALAPTEPSDPSALETPTPEPPQQKGEFLRLSAVLAAGWLATNVALQIGTLPLKFVLKDEVHLSATAVSSFFAIGNMSNYIKPLAGVMTDSIPIFGTRRRYYLLFSLLATGVFWILLGLAPRSYAWMLPIYTVMYFGVMFTSTTLGGVMVEVGNRFKAAGRLTSQRIGMFKVAELTGGPIAGYLANMSFILPACICAALHLALIPFLMRFLPPEGGATLDRGAWVEVKRQGRVLIHSRTLLGAAGMIFLLAAAPGVGTPLFFYQTNVLGFSKQFIGNLGLIGAASGMAAAALYYPMCRRYNLKVLVAASIVVHSLGVLFYLAYHSWQAAVVITALSGVTGTLAMLPVYDIAARATPKGSEAIGYAVMMSVWNLTNMWADLAGSFLFDLLGRNLTPLIWVDAVTTMLAVIAVPFMPRALTTRESAVPS